MKNKCFFYFMVLILFSLCFSNVNLSSKKNFSFLHNKDVQDFIEYLANLKKEKYQLSNNKLKSSHKHNTVLEEDNQFSNFLESSSKTLERGKGCESLNKCSGKGTCSNGVCTCDDGYDYFDCSQETSK